MEFAFYSYLREDGSHEAPFAPTSDDRGTIYLGWGRLRGGISWRW